MLSGRRELALQVLDLVYSPGTDQDGELADALRDAGNTIVASNAELVRKPKSRLLEIAASTAPVPTVAAVATVGLANISPDPSDGVVRSLPLVVEEGAGGRLTPALSLAALARVENLSGPIILRSGGVQLGNRLIPTGRLGLFEVNYSAALKPGGDRLSYVSAIDVIQGRFDPADLRGRIAVVGVVDPALGDHHLAPDDKVGGIPGVYIHANALNTMLTNSYLSPADRPYTLAWVLALALIVSMATQFLPVSSAAAATGAGAVGYVFFAFARFDGGLIVDLVYPNLAMAVAYVGTLGLRYGSEARQRRRLATVLSQYVPPQVARHLLDRRGTGELPTGTITFLFTDVVGSTSAWESHPRLMSEAMRRHDALVERAVTDNGGAVVRPRGEGDSRFAVFVVPHEAVAAAADLALSFATEKWPTPSPVRLRTALHTGEADLREGDYYGSPVNRCARIRSVAEPGQVLLSQATVALVAEQLPAGTTVRHLGPRELKDLAQPEEILRAVHHRP